MPVRVLLAIGLLLLLLYHTIGVSVAVWCFEESYEVTSPVSSGDEWKVVKIPISLPYTMSWENPDGQTGLVQEGDEFYNIAHQRYENDTLYTVLKTNRNARDRFVELADQVNQLVNQESAPAKHPLSGLLKLLSERITTYLLTEPFRLEPPVAQLRQSSAVLAEWRELHPSAPLSVLSPPPRA
ncbi:hypothetical protein BN8_02209 [Fibrisoma limi BUZ 3]|uniref:Uncharacterized protein n=1 Tax=Fibrisoma limi BUZ 3 TaxID=1185876 RepID=I2GGW2_9BACT|nr:hypothetical protein BN8_02209 [Fibrisoma limi BUZ 3]